MALVDAGFRLRVEFTDNSGYHTTRTYDLAAADMAAVLVAYEGLRRDYLAMRAERDDARRQAAELDARLTRMTHDSAARDRVAPMTAWKDDER